jgi:hypothetical protein
MPWVAPAMTMPGMMSHLFEVSTAFATLTHWAAPFIRAVCVPFIAMPHPKIKFTHFV